MKKIIIIIFIILISSCSKTPINGKLDGMWQLMKIEYHHGEDTEELEKVFYSVQLHLIRIHQVHEGSLEGSNMSIYLGRFIHTSDSLIVSDFRVYKNESIHATPEQLKPYGISSSQEHFCIEELNSRKMTLNSEYARLFFRKF